MGTLKITGHCGESPILIKYCDLHERLDLVVKFYSGFTISENLISGTRQQQFYFLSNHTYPRLHKFYEENRDTTHLNKLREDKIEEFYKLFLEDFLVSKKPSLGQLGINSSRA